MDECNTTIWWHHSIKIYHKEKANAQIRLGQKTNEFVYEQNCIIYLKVALHLAWRASVEMKTNRSKMMNNMYFCFFLEPGHCPYNHTKWWTGCVTYIVVCILLLTLIRLLQLLLMENSWRSAFVTQIVSFGLRHELQIFESILCGTVHSQALWK